MATDEQIPDYISSDIHLLSAHFDISNLDISELLESIEVSFMLNVGDYGQSKVDFIYPKESITLKYKKQSAKCAPEVISGRADFPKNVAHLNPVEDESIASICLWRKGGTSELYQQRGILELISILKEWLEDASTGRLEHDGWEPRPVTSGINIQTSTRILQEMASCPEALKILKTEVKTLLFKDSLVIGFCRTSTNWSKTNKINSPLRPFKWSDVCDITGYLVCDPDEDISRHNKLILNINDLKNYSKNRSLHKLISKLQSLTVDKNQSRACIVIVAHNRPLQIVDEVPDQSENTQAKKIEPVGFFLFRNPNEITFNVENINIKSPASSKLLQSVSGGKNPTKKHLGIIGCGALGSSIADQLARRGMARFSLWDNDSLEVHNHARHVLNIGNGAEDLLSLKSQKLERHLKNIHVDLSCTSHTEIFSTKSQQRKLVGIEHLIDSTGSDLDADWSNGIIIPVSRLFISDQGRIGILQTHDGKGGADMLDLDALIYLKSTNHSFISTWLNQQSTLSNKLIGFGCSSATLEMPWSTILNHSSGLMPSLLKVIKTPEPSIMVNLLDTDGNPKGAFQLYNDEIFHRYRAQEDTGLQWQVSITEEMHEKMKSIRERMLPAETAGYLLGLFNFESRRISIVFASDGSCIQKSTNSVVLDAISNDSEVTALLRSCNNMLLPLGTWHSHPSISAQASNKDLSTLDNIAIDRAIPTVMLILADSDLNVLVKYNRFSPLNKK
jgi:proteasome lid subunit RPN8/RPN11